MVLCYTNEVGQDFKNRMFWWYTKLHNIKLKIWLDPWLDFMLCWMIFDAYLTEISQLDIDRKKLDYFYQNKCDFKDCLLENWSSLLAYRIKLKECSSIQDMRPQSNREVSLEDENNLKQVFDFIYQIRCNLFHGAKNIKNEKDYKLVKYASKFLRESINIWMNYVKPKNKVDEI